MAPLPNASGVRDHRFACTRQRRTLCWSEGICTSCEFQCLAEHPARPANRPAMAANRAYRQEQLGRSRAVVVASDSMWRILDDFAVTDRPVTVIPNPIAIPAAVVQPPPRDPELLLCVGMFNENKGQDVLLQAVAGLADDHPDLRVAFAGKGPYRAVLEKLAQRLGIADRVLWLGHLSTEVLADWYRRAALVVVPGRWPEPFGRVVLEAGAHGGKGTDAHKATVVGDTVGDPFKDTSGPSLNILIKLMSMVSVVFAGLIVQYALNL